VWGERDCVCVVMVVRVGVGGVTEWGGVC
jgi:hypothetical protein